MKRVGVLTCGGDAPGMNPCIRAVVRTALHHGFEVLGVHHGYSGLIDAEFELMDARSVGGIIQKGGTILSTARSPEFMTQAGQAKAVRNLGEQDIDALVVIGGDGTQRGSLTLHEAGVSVVGIPSTIDNDLAFTDVAIGVDTALNTILDAVDKIKDTASSHHRAFLIETMGRNSGYLALMAGVAGGAEVIVLPEEPTDLEELAHEIAAAYERGKAHFIAIVAEGATPHIQEIADHLGRQELGYEVRVSILGHIQRGGSPSAFDRILATRLGIAAVDQLVAGKTGRMVGLVGNQIAETDLAEVARTAKKPDLEFYRRASILAR
ncbi:MAG: 6-phosphofructokinase [Anaerolineae bacterium]